MEREFIVIFSQSGIEKRVTVFANSTEEAKTIVNKEFGNIAIFKAYDPEVQKIVEMQRRQKRLQEEAKKAQAKKVAEEAAIAFWKAVRFTIVIILMLIGGGMLGVLTGQKLGGLLVTDSEKNEIISAQKKKLNKVYLFAKVVDENKGLRTFTYEPGLYVYPGTYKSYLGGWVIDKKTQCFPLRNIKHTKNLEELIHAGK